MKPSKNTLIEIMRNHTNKQAALYFNVSAATLARWLKSYGLGYYDLKYPNVPKVPATYQLDLISACLLGNGTLDKHGRFKLKLKRELEPYLRQIHMALAPYTTNDIIREQSKKPSRINGKVSHRDEDWNGEWSKVSYFYTPGFPFFKKLRSKWYPSEKKQVPRDIQLSLSMIAHWYCQNGNNNQSRKNITIHVNSFTENDVDFLIAKLEEVMEIRPIKRWVNGKPIISFGARQYHNFINMVKPLVCETFQYKIDTSNVPITKPGYGANKLDMEKAKRIRALYATDKYTQQKLGSMFGVTQSMVGRIVNNEAHKVDVMLGGSADVSVSF